MSGLVGDNLARASGVIASAGGGTILQVKSVKLETTASNAGTTPSQITQFDMSFAATESDSKLYFQAFLNIGGNGSGTAFYFYDVTNTAIVGAYADAAGSRLRTSFGDATASGLTTQAIFATWHEPGTTTSIDYTIFGNMNQAYTLYMNRNYDYANDAKISNANTASTFTITEYAGSVVTLT